MRNGFRRVSGILRGVVFAGAVLAIVWGWVAGADPKTTDLYKEMKVSNPDEVFIPPLILRHVIQLPTPWADPLAESQAVPAGSVLNVRNDGPAVVVETGAFALRFTLEGKALHVVARRKSADHGDVHPGLAVKDPGQALALHVVDSPDRIALFAPSRGAPTPPVCTVLRKDASLEVPRGKGVDRFRFVHSRQDGRIYVISPLHPEDRVYGLGMKAGSLNRAGQKFVMWNSDAYGYHESKDPLYASIPFYLQTRCKGDGARGVFVDDASDVEFDFGFSRRGESFFSTANAQADFYLFAGAALPDVVADYQALTGTAALPPAWALGYHQSSHTYFPEKRLLDLAREFRDRKVPCDAFYLDIIHQDQYRPFTWNAAHFPDPKGMIEKLHGMGLKVLTIVDPGIQLNEDYPVFNEGRKEGYFLKTLDGKLYANNIWPGYSAFPDFLQAKCRQWWADRHRAYLDVGVDAFKNDMSEPATFNKAWSMIRYDETTKMPGPLVEGTLDENVVSRSPDFGTVPHRFFHNAYGLYEGMATWKAQADYDGRRPFVLMRNTFASGQRYSAIWTGDILSDWPSLRHSIQLLLSLNLSGFPVCGADNGGFGGRCTPELFARWTQFSCFSPFFRTHYFFVEQCIPKEPWTFGPEVEKIAVDCIRLRYRLFPYLYTSLRTSLQERRPLMQPVFFRHEADPAAWDAAQQYYWGDDFLVAPVTEPGATGRAVYLPAGRWYDFWTGVDLESKGESRYVDAPLEKIPVFIRGGSIVPSMEPGENTAAFPASRIVLDCYLGQGTAEGRLYQDDGKTRACVEQGKWTLLRFSLTEKAGDPTLEVRREGVPDFAPKRLLVRLHGAGKGLKNLGFNGKSNPLTVRNGIPEAEITLE
ncbi:MAG: glycoside hydrolase family 31 protein [Acidobacteria bacterium]|nr:glycoside hydrolase family 31 protein [Acidobacteriota bacterium]